MGAGGAVPREAAAVPPRFRTAQRHAFFGARLSSGSCVASLCTTAACGDWGAQLVSGKYRSETSQVGPGAAVVRAAVRAGQLVRWWHETGFLAARPHRANLLLHVWDHHLLDLGQAREVLRGGLVISKSNHGLAVAAAGVAVRSCGGMRGRGARSAGARGCAVAHLMATVAVVCGGDNQTSTLQF